MGGPMPNLACGKSSWTAWANTCAVECRMTLRPSSVLAATGTTSASTAGAQLKSRSLPSASRTTTIASGVPRRGNPASPTAAAAVVPAGTRIGAPGGGCAALIAWVLQVLGWLMDRDRSLQCYRGRTPSGLARLETHEQRFGFGQQGVAVPQPPGHEDLAAVLPVHSRVELQLLLDRHDVAVVDLEVRGALPAAARQQHGRQPEDRVEQHAQRAAVHSAVAAQVEPGEARPAVDPPVVALAGRHGD